MACSGLCGDYLCPGWRARADLIRERDGKRCRGCNRHEDEIRIEVHHRIYGTPGPCGECVLTGVKDEDLVTLCVDCHDSITDVRRRVRYGAQEISVTIVVAPRKSSSVTLRKTSIEADVVAATAETLTVTLRKDGIEADVVSANSEVERIVVRRRSDIF